MAMEKKAKQGRRSKAGGTKPQVTHIPPARTTWDNARTDIGHNIPWKEPGLSTSELFTRIAKEAKACLYELHRAYVEVFYHRKGWPADAKAWEPFDKERDALLGNDEVPPDQHGVGTLYGITYGAQRYGPHYPNEVIPLESFGSTPDSMSNQLTRLWLNRYFTEIRTVLSRGHYADDLKEEIRTAFADFRDFRIGTGAGAPVMERLRKDEEGTKAIVMTELVGAEISRVVMAIVDEPFGIERDFTHLWHAARCGFNLALAHDMQDVLGIWHNEVIRYNAQQDTLGVEPFAIYSKALPKEHAHTPDLQQVLDRWTQLYLERVDAIAYRWKQKVEVEEVDMHLTTLWEHVRSWEPYTSLFDTASATIRTMVEDAQRKLKEGIAAKIEAPGGTVSPRGIEWTGSVQILAWLLRELAEKGWINAPRHRSTSRKFVRGSINASAFTKALAPHFSTINAVTLGQELKGEGGTVPAQDVEGFKIPQRPS